MEAGDIAEQVPVATRRDEQLQAQPLVADERSSPDLRASKTPVPPPANNHAPAVYVFNPFTEGYLAHGKAFTPVRHQALLAADLANLPQFLCGAEDVVLLTKRPSAGFLKALQQAGFPPPEFVELSQGRIHPADRLCQQKLSDLRPWAWGPDSVKLFEPLFGRVARRATGASPHFNDNIARLYSKAWSAEFLRKVLARCRGGNQRPTEPWLCSAEEAGVTVDTLQDAVEAIDAIRGQGHQRVVVKEAHGLAGHNALRLWEPELLPAQQQWLAHALRGGRQLVVERWLERALDFSVQLEMGPRQLKLCGYTGLVNDRKGQFLANWAEANYRWNLPAQVAALLHSSPDISERLQRLYREMFSLLEAELKRVGFIGPVSIDAFVYRTPQGDCRLKPVVEINPRYTMGRVAVELMKHAARGTCGLFRLVSRAQARAEGFADFQSYAAALGERRTLQLEGQAKIRQGAVCLNEPGQAQVCLATFEVSSTMELTGLFRRQQLQGSP